jgi:Protein of unknown function (DUF3306)
MSESFLSRWSRRKDEARRNALEPSPEVDEAAAVTPDGVSRDTDDRAIRTTEPALTPEEVAALPKIDELTADTDITAFLRRGVPEALKNAALRKSWMLDPAIRDFVGHARDYDYDWNTPGGAPGCGALDPSDDVAAMVRRVFGEPSAKPSGKSEEMVAQDRPATDRSADKAPGTDGAGETARPSERETDRTESDV